MTENLSVAAWLEIEEMSKTICERMGIDPSYCDRVDIELGRVTLYLYRGYEGRCKGPKYIVDGEPVREVLVFELPTAVVS